MYLFAVHASQTSWPASRSSQKSPLQALQSMEAKAGPKSLPSPTFPPSMVHTRMRPVEDRPLQVRQLAMSQGINTLQLENRTQLRQLLLKDENKSALPPKLSSIQGLVSDIPSHLQDFPGQSPSSTSLDLSVNESDPDSSKGNMKSLLVCKDKYSSKHANLQYNLQKLCKLRFTTICDCIASDFNKIDS